MRELEFKDLITKIRECRKKVVGKKDLDLTGLNQAQYAEFKKILDENHTLQRFEVGITKADESGIRFLVEGSEKLIISYLTICHCDINTQIIGQIIACNEALVRITFDTSTIEDEEKLASFQRQLLADCRYVDIDCVANSTNPELAKIRARIMSIEQARRLRDFWQLKPPQEIFLIKQQPPYLNCYLYCTSSTIAEWFESIRTCSKPSAPAERSVTSTSHGKVVGAVGKKGSEVGVVSKVIITAKAPGPGYVFAFEDKRDRIYYFNGVVISAIEIHGSKVPELRNKLIKIADIERLPRILSYRELYDLESAGCTLHFSGYKNFEFLGKKEFDCLFGKKESLSSVERIRIIDHNLSEMGVFKSFVEELLPACPKLTELVLNNCQLNDEMVGFLFDYLLSNSQVTLSNLSLLGNNPIELDRIIGKVSKLFNTVRIQKINLGDGESFDLSKQFRVSAEKIEIVNYNLTVAFKDFIEQLLPALPKLTKLILNNCQLNDEMVISLADYLLGNPQLQLSTLSLVGNTTSEADRVAEKITELFRSTKVQIVSVEKNEDIIRDRVMPLASIKDSLGSEINSECLRQLITWSENVHSMQIPATSIFDKVRQNITRLEDVSFLAKVRYFEGKKCNLVESLKKSGNVFGYLVNHILPACVDLSELSLASCGITDAMGKLLLDSLVARPQSCLAKLDLSNNQLTDVVVLKIEELLKIPKKLVAIDLSNNQIRATDLLTLVSVLNSNRTLVSFRCITKGISTQDVQNFIEKIKGNKALLEICLVEPPFCTCSDYMGLQRRRDWEREYKIQTGRIERYLGNNSKNWASLVVYVNEEKIKGMLDLFNAGVSIYAYDINTGNTLLHLAARQGKSKVIEALLKERFNRKIINHEKKIALEMVQSDCPEHDKIVALLESEQISPAPSPALPVAAMPQWSPQANSRKRKAPGLAQSKTIEGYFFKGKKAEGESREVSPAGSAPSSPPAAKRLRSAESEAAALPGDLDMALSVMQTVQSPSMMVGPVLASDGKRERTPDSSAAAAFAQPEAKRPRLSESVTNTPANVVMSPAQSPVPQSSLLPRTIGLHSDPNLPYFMALNGNADFFEEIGQDQNFDVNRKYSDGCTLLHMAALRGHTRIINILLSRYKGSIDINCLDIVGRTPLHYACLLADRYPTYEAVELLCNSGLMGSQDGEELTMAANPNAQDVCGITPLYLLAGGFDKDANCDVESANIKRIAKFLLARGACNFALRDLELRVGDVSVLHKAVYKGNYHLVSALLTYKVCDLAAQDANRDTAFHYAVRHKRADIFERMLQEPGAREACELTNSIGKDVSALLAIMRTISAEDVAYSKMAELYQTFLTNRYPTADSGIRWISSFNNNLFYGSRTPNKRLNLSFDDSHSTLERDVVKAPMIGGNKMAAMLSFIVSTQAYSAKTQDNKRMLINIRLNEASYIHVTDAWQHKEAMGDRSRSPDMKDRLLFRLGLLPPDYATQLADDSKNPGKALSPKAIEELYQKPAISCDKAAGERTFEELFHHSEPSLLDNLEKDTAIEEIIDKLRQERDFVPGCKIYAVLLNLFSERYVCANCEVAILGEQNPDSKFLTKLRVALKRENCIIARDGNLRMLTCVSSKIPYPPGMAKKRAADHTPWQVDLRSDRSNIFLQKDIESTGAQGTMFISRKIS